MRIKGVQIEKYLKRRSALVHKMEQINSLSKIPAMRFLGFFLPPAEFQVSC
jgi:hypothetical protein